MIFFSAPHQFGVACPSGAEKVIHGLKSCIEEHWTNEDFTVLKIDMCNAFNFVSCQALLNECATHFPELLPLASRCYSQHPFLRHAPCSAFYCIFLCLQLLLSRNEGPHWSLY